MGLLDILNSIQTSGMDPRAQSAPSGQGGSQGMSPIAKALLGLLVASAAKSMSRAAPGQPGGGAGGGGSLGDILGGMLGGAPGGGAPGAGAPAGGGSLGDILGGILGGASGGGAPGAGGSTGGGSLGDILGGILGGASGGGAPGGGTPGRGTPPGGGGGGLGDILGGLLGGASAGTALNGGLGDLLKQFEQAGQGDAARSWVGTGPNKAISPKDLESALGGNTLDTLAQHTGMGRDALARGLSQHLPGLVDKLTPNGRLPTPDEAGRMI
jgi:uncharacterized protein YidB (DUF937 family)